MSAREFVLPEDAGRVLEIWGETSSFPHTLLIEGGGPESRLAFARSLANRILCTGKGKKPCGVCPACVKCRANSHPDLLEYGELQSASAFKVETCRAIRADSFILPNDGDRKVYILKETQNMNDSAENALLKILEEPPASVYFILTCDSRGAMLETVLSRAAVLALGDDGKARAYSEETEKAAAELARSLLRGGALETLTASAALEKDREGFRSVTLRLCELFKDALAVKGGAAKGLAAELAAKFTPEQLYALYRTAQALCDGAAGNQNHNLLLTSLCYKLRRCVR